MQPYKISFQGRPAKGRGANLREGLLQATATGPQSRHGESHPVRYRRNGREPEAPPDHTGLAPCTTYGAATVLIDSSKYRVAPNRHARLGKFPSRDDGDLAKDDARNEFRRLRERLIELEELMYAEGKHALLVVLQGMDTSGKDSTVRSVLAGVGPTGVRVVNFTRPSAEEREHDFLWRVHREVPRAGRTVIFNRSHYEDVLVARVSELVPRKRWRERYDHINAFEKMLSDEGATVVKFFLHISRAYQKRRLQRRLDNPKKHWKFDPGDLPVRRRWNDYMQAYEDALSRCSTPHAPWYVIPAERRWFRNLLVAQVLVETLESLDMKYPEPTFDPSQIVIP
jgi:PPK2 family polyphosphate:nucleotide phosphotransferase